MHRICQYLDDEGDGRRLCDSERLEVLLVWYEEIEATAGSSTPVLDPAEAQRCTKVQVVPEDLE